MNSDNGRNLILEKLKNNYFNLIILIGQDNFDFKKKNEFIVYIGSHGDKGANCADIVLPGSAYTEQDGYFTNLEGKIQKSFKASYPPGDAKEDWLIINELSELLKRKKLFEDKYKLVGSMINYLKINQKKNNFEQVFNENFTNEKIVVMETIIKAIKKLNIAVIFIEHDMEIVEKFANRVVAFYNGQILGDGRPEEILKQKDVVKYIVGSSHA